VVTWPEFAGYARQMQLIGKEMPRDIEDLIEKVWDIQVAVYYQWDSQNPLTITTALDALTKLQTAFELNWGLPDTNGFPTCEMGTIVEPKVRKVTTVDNLDFTAAMLTVRTRQALPILY